MSEQCERMIEQTSKWPCTAVWFLDCSGPQCLDSYEWTVGLFEDLSIVFDEFFFVDIF